MSACELNAGNSFISERNLSRIELPDKCLNGREVYKFFIHEGRKCRLYRHVYAGGGSKCDIIYWRQPGSPNRKLLKMVRAEELEPIQLPENELYFLRKLCAMPREGM